MCVSFGVMLPVGNPPNAIVFSYGHVQISDMVRHAHKYGHAHFLHLRHQMAQEYKVSKLTYVIRGLGSPPAPIFLTLKSLIRRLFIYFFWSPSPLQVKAGFGVNLIGVAVVMLAITTWGVPLFNLTEFPAWAVARNVTGSL